MNFTINKISAKIVEKYDLFIHKYEFSYWTTRFAVRERRKEWLSAQKLFIYLIRNSLKTFLAKYLEIL